MATLSELGEFGLIERLAQILGETAAPNQVLRLGIGDDAAVWTPRPGADIVATTDALVEGVHFDLRFTSWHDLGWKALAANVSDAAAMGAAPRFALITLGIGPGRALEEFEALYRGLREHADRFGVLVVGGDVVSAPVTFLNVALLAEAQADRLLRRDAALPGDLLAVTGNLGDSAAGLRLLMQGAAYDDGDREYLIERHNRPMPRVAEAQTLVDVGVRCGMDLSDGLLGDVGKLAKRSGVRVELRLADLPVSEPLRRVFGTEAADLALAGGEDYELLVAAPPEVVEQARAALRGAEATPLTVVGTVLETERGAPRVRVIGPDGAACTARLASWEHPL